LVLVCAAIAVKLFPSLQPPPPDAVEEILTVALIYILFDGGMRIGVARFRRAALPIALTGVLGTFLTVAGGALLLRYAFGFEWFPALLVATAIAPTDPAVVFSVLGQREISGRSGTVLEGESGANDPVGIALMSSLVTVGAVSVHAFGQIGLQFLLQMAVGALVGLVGGRALLWFMRQVSLPGEGLYALRTMACAALLYGLSTIAHGSGFLAVFLAGIVIGDERAPYKHEIERFLSGAGRVAEIAAFGFWPHRRCDVVPQRHVLPTGLALAVVVAFVVRPLFVGLCCFPRGCAKERHSFIRRPEGRGTAVAGRTDARARGSGRLALRYRSSWWSSPFSCKAA
jgi:cell volume regulation protein A